MKTYLTTITLGMVLSVAATRAVNVVTGELWHVPEAIAQNAIPANVPGTPPDVTFNVDSPLNFSATSATVGTFLNSGSAFNIVENTTGTLGTLMDNGNQGTLIRFDGMVSLVNGQDIAVGHDDGLTLIIDGINLGYNPGPTGPTVTHKTYTGPTGTFPFDLVYTECCGGPAELIVTLPLVDIPRGTPDAGSTAALLAGAFAVIGALRRRLV